MNYERQHLKLLAHNFKFVFLEFNWVIIVENPYHQTKKSIIISRILCQKRKKKLDIVCEEIKFHSAVGHAQSFFSIQNRGRRILSPLQKLHSSRDFGNTRREPRQQQAVLGEPKNPPKSHLFFLPCKLHVRDRYNNLCRASISKVKYTVAFAHVTFLKSFSFLFIRCFIAFLHKRANSFWQRWRRDRRYYTVQTFHFLFYSFQITKRT